MPGLDGTGLLFKPLLALFPKTIDVCVVDLNSLQQESMVDSIVEQVGQGNCVILAESFSGHIAYQMAQRLQAQVKKLVIVASFLRCPSRLTLFRKLLPIVLIKKRILPNRLLNYLAFGNRATADTISLFYHAINEVEDGTLKGRLDLVHRLKSEPRKLQVPCIYIGATDDYLIRKTSYQDFQDLFSNFEHDVVEGGHFLVQSNPEYFAKLLTEMAE